jgi:hypothetical protein
MINGPIWWGLSAKLVPENIRKRIESQSMLDGFMSVLPVYAVENQVIFLK